MISWFKMNINFTIGLGFLEFCCHFVAMVCYIGAGKGFMEGHKIDDGFLPLFFGLIYTTIGAHL